METNDAHQSMKLPAGKLRTIRSDQVLAAMYCENESGAGDPEGDDLRYHRVHSRRESP
jgi:hypothetical protein